MKEYLNTRLPMNGGVVGLTPRHFRYRLSKTEWAERRFRKWNAKKLRHSFPIRTVGSFAEQRRAVFEINVNVILFFRLFIVSWLKK